jgi:hypothetical protein
MFPTHYIRPVEGLVLKNGVPWLVYGVLTKDGMFTAIDGRKYPGNMAVPINQLIEQAATEAAGFLAGASK